MKPLYRGLALALLQVLIVSSLGAKLLYDRATRPHIWVKVAPVDPDLPIRGRYLALALDVPAEGFSMHTQPSSWQKDKDGNPVLETYRTPYNCNLALRNQQLVAVANEQGEYTIRPFHNGDGSSVIVLTQTAFFIPEHLPDPSRRHDGEELWIEATIPRKGPPRPIQLGVKKDGVLTPLAIN
jgi:hypothetical protein